jgi:hypothetical protein
MAVEMKPGATLDPGTPRENDGRLLFEQIVKMDLEEFAVSRDREALAVLDQD